MRSPACSDFRPPTPSAARPVAQSSQSEILIAASRFVLLVIAPSRARTWGTTRTIAIGHTVQQGRTTAGGLINTGYSLSSPLLHLSMEARLKLQFAFRGERRILGRTRRQRLQGEPCRFGVPVKICPVKATEQRLRYRRSWNDPPQSRSTRRSPRTHARN